MKNEPVLIWPTVGLLVGALFREFLPDLGGNVVNLVVDLVIVAGPVLVGLFYARSQVDGPVTVAKKEALK